jgi:hypothetical protein
MREIDGQSKPFAESMKGFATANLWCSLSLEKAIGPAFFLRRALQEAPLLSSSSEPSQDDIFNHREAPPRLIQTFFGKSKPLL